MDYNTLTTEQLEDALKMIAQQREIIIAELNRLLERENNLQGILQKKANSSVPQQEVPAETSTHILSKGEDFP